MDKLKGSLSSRQEWALRAEIKKLTEEKKDLTEALVSALHVAKYYDCGKYKAYINFSENILKQHKP